MPAFLTAFGAPLLLTVVVLAASERAYFLYDAENALWLFALVLGLPMCVALVLTSLWRRLWRPRFLVSTSMSAALRGALAALALMAIVSAVQSSVSPWRYDDLWLMGLASAGAVLVVILPARRARRAGHCECGYCLAGLSPGVCPECGRSMTAPNPTS